MNGDDILAMVAGGVLLTAFIGLLVSIHRRTAAVRAEHPNVAVPKQEHKPGDGLIQVEKWTKFGVGELAHTIFLARRASAETAAGNLRNGERYTLELLRKLDQFDLSITADIRPDVLEAARRGADNIEYALFGEVLPRAVSGVHVKTGQAAPREPAPAGQEARA